MGIVCYAAIGATVAVLQLDIGSGVVLPLVNISVSCIWIVLYYCLKPLICHYTQLLLN